jgi:micrococcal nuclease
MNKLKKLIYPLIFLSLIFNAYLYQQLTHFKKMEGKFQVIEVLDGDSFVIAPDQSVRLANLNAPEINLCLGDEAKQALSDLILGQYVDIEPVGRDNFKRVIGLVYLDDQLVNETMIRQGWAKYASGGKAEKAIIEELKKAGEDAKAEEINLWSPKCYQTENPANPKCLIKGNIGKHDREKIYHFPGCGEYERTVVELNLGEQWFCSEKEADQAGYKKSQHCYDKSF